MEIWSLCTVNFGQKSSKLNSRPVYCSRLYSRFYSRPWQPNLAQSLANIVQKSCLFCGEHTYLKKRWHLFFKSRLFRRMKQNGGGERKRGLGNWIFHSLHICHLSIGFLWPFFISIYTTIVNQKIHYSITSQYCFSSAFKLWSSSTIRSTKNQIMK